MRAASVATSNCCHFRCHLDLWSCCVSATIPLAAYVATSNCCHSRCHLDLLSCWVSTTIPLAAYVATSNCCHSRCHLDLLSCWVSTTIPLAAYVATSNCCHSRCHLDLLSCWVSATIPLAAYVATSNCCHSRCHLALELLGLYNNTSGSVCCYLQLLSLRCHLDLLSCWVSTTIPLAASFPDSVSREAVSRPPDQADTRTCLNSISNTIRISALRALFNFAHRGETVHYRLTTPPLCPPV
ncbi:hypothetical protein J6590_081043 [Homalodisca vitripennis]|nr:hypothetical protein J6590_081043 [Homalodisca vitripennis]